MSTADELFGGDLAEVGERPEREQADAPAKRKKPAATPTPQPSAYAGPIEFTIFGEPASKANSREIGILKWKDKATGEMKSRPTSRKSDKALGYEESALRQIPPKARLQLTEPLRVTLRIFYASERPDLDESIVLDVMQNRYQSVKVPGKAEKVRVLLQAGVYVNDRQVREKHVFHGIDKLMPRTEVRIESLSPQRGLL